MRALKPILLLLFIFVGLSSTVFAQIKPVYTQYMRNQYLLNPAVAGSQDYFDIKTGTRHQWVGVEGYPRNYFVSAQGSIGKHKLSKTSGKSDFFHQTKNYEGDASFHGVGGILSADRTGPTSVISFYATYNYNLLLGNGIRISLGAAPGFQNFYINSAELNIDNARDLSVFAPDLTLGAWLYNHSFFVGLSSHQILETKLNDYNLYYNQNKLNRHYFATAGYKFVIHEHLDVVPSLMFRYIYPFPSDVDINLKAHYNEFLWGGVTYRPVSRSFVGMVGFQANHRFSVNYAYDYFNSYLNTVSAGTHEIMVGIKLHTEVNMHSPSDFW